MRRPASLSPLTLVACVLAAACSRPDAQPGAESATGTPPPALAPEPDPSVWAGALGRFLLLPSESESLAVVLLPAGDPERLVAGTRVTLLTAAGDTATAVASLDTLQCADAPILRLTGDVPAGWSVGLHGQTAIVIRMDSVEALTAADSARITTALARLGSQLTANVQPEFKGLPFTVARARRFQVDGTVIVAAHLIRRVPQEAAPLEEHTFIIAERPVATPDAFRIAWSQQSEGTEENAEHFEVLAAFRASDGVMMVLSRDRVTHSTYQLLRRADAGDWRVTWSRDIGC